MLCVIVTIIIIIIVIIIIMIVHVFKDQWKRCIYDSMEEVQMK